MRIYCLIAFLVVSINIYAQTKKVAVASTAIPRPKLVVGIVIDQMRWDYLYRYYERYGSTGFKRLLNEGFSCENTMIDYLPTVTAIGHSTIYSGSVPAIHGITGNDFYINKLGKQFYCVGDSTVETVGSNTNQGKMSPRNLLATTITDELKLATNFKSKVISISLKERSSVLPGGHTPNSAYWFDNTTGSWITSTFYMLALPTWVNKFNDLQWPKKYLGMNWNTLYDINTYQQSTPDSNAYESLIAGKIKPVFPIETATKYATDFEVFRNLPYANTYTLDFAKAAIEAEQMGQSTTTDFLAVSCSSTDILGHKVTPNSVEIEDMYLRLDKDLGNFLSYLDEKIGKGNYTVFLSADHGVANNPTFLKDHNIPGGLTSNGIKMKELNKILESTFNAKNIVLSFLNYQVHFNYPLMDSLKIDKKQVVALTVNFLKASSDVLFVADIDNLDKAAIPQEIKERMVNGYNKERSGDVFFSPNAGYFSSSSTTGAEHSVWNPYDAHIPLLFMGWGINKGATNRQTNMTDIAATIAALLHVQMPSGCIGKPIIEVLKK